MEETIHLYGINGTSKHDSCESTEGIWGTITYLLDTVFDEGAGKDASNIARREK